VKATAFVFALVVALSLAAALIDTWRMETLVYGRQQRAALKHLLQAAAPGVKQEITGRTYSKIGPVLQRFFSGRHEVEHYLVTDSEGIVLFDSEGKLDEQKFDTDALRKDLSYLSEDVVENDFLLGKLWIGTRFSSMLVTERTAELVGLGNTISANMRQHILSFNFGELLKYTNDIMAGNPDILYCIVVRKDGKVLVHTQEREFEGGSLEDEVSARAFEASLQQPVVIQEHPGEAFYERIRDISVVIPNKGKKLGVVRLGISNKGIIAEDLRTRFLIVMIWLGFAAVGLAASFFIIRRIVRPIVHLGQLARRIGAGDLDAKAEIRTGGDEIEQLGDAFNEMVDGLKERDFVKDTFGRYMTKQVADEILKNPGMITPGGRKDEVTVLFSDIRGFTTYAESRPAEEVVTQLNEYMSAMVDVVIKYEGVVDKFIGDAIMAVFGSPVKHGDDTLRAVKTALEMQSRLADLDKKWEKEGKQQFRIGIGLNTGDVIVGNIGDIRRMEYTVIGDNVNLASRIEGLTKEYNCPIIISGSTYEKVKDKVEIRKLESATVKGKTRSVDIYQLLGLKE